jgi:hypothetical protein
MASTNPLVFIGRVFIDENRSFDVFSSDLIPSPTGGLYSIVRLYARPTSEQCQENRSVEMTVRITLDLQQNPNFACRNDIADILRAVGLAKLKIALRQDKTPGSLPDVSIGTNNWEKLVALRGNGFTAKESIRTDYADRQILKRRIMNHLMKNGPDTTIADLKDSLAEEELTFRPALVQLRESGYVIQDRDRWYLSDQGERLCVAGKIKDTFPLENPINGSRNSDLETSSASSETDGHRWDVFICHASEDKAAVVLPLAKALEALGLKVWIDNRELMIGDSLRQKIDEGLVSSRYGIVVLSPDFFAKNWTRLELDALVSREANEGRKVILPVWHEVSKDDVARNSPILASKLSGTTHGGIDRLAEQLKEAMQ